MDLGAVKHGNIKRQQQSTASYMKQRR